MRSMTFIISFMALASIFVAWRAEAAEPRWSFGQELWLGGRVAPLGLALESESTLRWRFGKDGDALLESGHLDIGVYAGATPVMGMIGAVVELEPAAFFVLRGRAMQLAYFGTFGSIAGFESVRSDWSPEALSALEDADQGAATGGTWLDLDAQLRFAAGDFVAFASFHPMWLSVDVDAPATYEPYNDLMIATDDLVLDVNGCAGWRLTKAWFVGLRYQWMMSREAEQPRHTLAALTHWEATFSGTTVGFDGLAGIYLADPHRAGEPWLAIAGTLAWRL